MNTSDPSAAPSPSPAIASVVYYTAAWCGPARAYDTVLALVASDARHPIPVETRDIDTHEQAAVAHGVVGVPTLLALDAEGKVLGSLVGTRMSAVVQKWLTDPSVTLDP